MGTQAALDGLGRLVGTLPGVNNVRIHAHRNSDVGSDVGADVYLSGKPLRFNPGQVNAFGVELIVKLTVPATDLSYGEEVISGLIDELAKLEDSADGNSLDGAALDSNWGDVSMGTTEDESRLALVISVLATLRTHDDE